MMDKIEPGDEDTGASIQHRTVEKKLPRSLSRWFIGNPLLTVDLPHQTYNIFMQLEY
jgi:hypothetical protein